MCLTYTDLDRTDQVSHMYPDYYTDIDHTSQLDHIDHIDRTHVIIRVIWIQTLIIQIKSVICIQTITLQII